MRELVRDMPRPASDRGKSGFAYFFGLQTRSRLCLFRLFRGEALAGGGRAEPR